MSIRALYISLDTYSPIDRDGNAHCYDNTMCTFFEPVNQQAPVGARVLTLNAFRYYLRTDLFACSTTHSEYAALQSAAGHNMTAFWEEVYRQGYDYLLYEWNYTYRHLFITTAPGPSNTPSWVRLVPISTPPLGQHAAYRLMFNNAPAMSRADCRTDKNGIWVVSAPTGPY
jgi:hypothetical protein